ncbi:hypothetical protein ABZ851_25880 [Streptomyces sp. NPDC047049]|uniref:hypothetical protein n=1 Tax=Streptomyces sp. NPDC047049 TaxID=3156688 RepID=UPI0034065503
MGLINGAGYQLDPEAFEEITKGIRAATAELKELGFDIEAQLGRGFDRVSLDSVECGDDGLASVLESFCDRWGWGVRSLMQDANEFSKKLQLTAGIYYEQEQYLSDTLKQTTNAMLGDPSLTAEQLHKRSWSQIAEDNPFEQALHPDFDPNSAESREARDNMKGTAQKLAQDFHSVPDRMTHPFDDPAEVTTEFHEPKKSEDHGGSNK